MQILDNSFYTDYTEFIRDFFNPYEMLLKFFSKEEIITECSNLKIGMNDLCQEYAVTIPKNLKLSTTALMNLKSNQDDRYIGTEKRNVIFEDEEGRETTVEMECAVFVTSGKKHNRSADVVRNLIMDRFHEYFRDKEEYLIGLDDMSEKAPDTELRIWKKKLPFHGIRVSFNDFMSGNLARAGVEDGKDMYRDCYGALFGAVRAYNEEHNIKGVHDSSGYKDEILNKEAIENAPEEFKNFRPETKEQFMEKTAAFFKYRDPEGEYVTGKSTGHEVIENKRDKCSIPVDEAWIRYKRKENMPFAEAAEIIYEQFREISGAVAMEFAVRGMTVPGYGEPKDTGTEEEHTEIDL